MQIATVLYPRLTTLGAIGPYEVLRLLPDAEVRFVGAAPGPVDADGRVLIATAAGVDNASGRRGRGQSRSEPAAGSAGRARHGASREQGAGMNNATKGVQ